MKGNLSKSKTLKGEEGQPGNDGYSPKITVTDIENGHNVTIQDAFGLHSFDLKDGDKGEDGVSPIVNVTSTDEGQKIEITDKEGKKEFVIKDTEINPDLAQNDETAPDYVKNRTHYEIPAKNYGYTEFDLESTSMDVSDGIQTVSLTDLLEPGVAYPYKTDKGSGTFTVDFDYQYADGQVILGDTGYTGDYFKDNGGSYINFGIGHDKEGYIQIGTPASVKQLDEKYIPESIARVSDVEEILDELHAYAQNLIGGDA